MKELPDVYYLETIEQMRALSDELRQRILEAISRKAMTVTQIGEELNVSPAKIHYHVRELERVGLVQLAETRERGSILEKYYLPIAHGILVPAALLQGTSLDETVALTQDFMDGVALGVRQALQRLVGKHGERRGRFALQREHVWVSDDEWQDVVERISSAISAYANPRGVEGEKERTFVLIGHDTHSEPEDLNLDRLAGADPAVRPDTSGPRVRSAVAAGIVRYSAAELRRFLERGQMLNLSVFGICTFDEDVTPELAERVVHRFRHRGQLNASPAVRQVLQRKKETSALRS